MDKEELSLLQIMKSHLDAYLASNIFAESYVTAEISQIYHHMEKSRYMVYLFIP